MSCPNCKKGFSNKKNLKYHIDHNVCDKSNKKCPKCNHQFCDKPSLRYHMNNKVCEKKYHITLKSSMTHEKYQSLSKDDLILKLVNLEGKYESLQENPQNIQNIQNNIVFPTAYGKEDIDYVCRKLGDILGPLVKKKPFQSISSLFEKMHTAKQLPEYHNVYTTSEKSSFALVSDGDRFRNRPKKTVIDRIIEDKRSILNNYIDSNGEQLGEKVLDKYEKYQEKLDSDPLFRRNLELEIAGMLLDMKLIIADDEKTRLLLEKVDEGNFELDQEEM